MKTKTPGYNCRLAVWFTTDRRGRRVAYRFSPMQQRNFRVGLAAAELWVAQDQADLITNPLTSSEVPAQ